MDTQSTDKSGVDTAPLGGMRERLKGSVMTPPIMRRQPPAGGAAGLGYKLWMKERRDKIAYAVALGSMAFALVMTWVSIRSIKSAEKVFVVDAAGNIHFGPLEDATSDSELFSVIVIQATIALFSRSPVGFDYPELLQKTMDSFSQRRATDDLNAQMKDIKARSLHQKVEISRIRAVREVSGKRFIVVEGQLLRTGQIEGRAIPTESQVFVVVYELIRNPNLAGSGMYPFIISNLEIREPSSYGR